MPPALSDDEGSDQSSGDEQILPTKAKPERNAEPEEEVEDGSEGEEEGEDEYVVEKILGHKKQRGVFVYDVKWQGYDDPKDRTWEPKNNLTGAVDILHEYWEEIGGDPETTKGTKRKGRKSGVASQSATPSAPNKKMKKEVEWEPPKGSWEHDVDHVDTVEETIDPTTNKAVRYAYLVWSNQKKSQHPLDHVYMKCPQKMLQYYENHLVFSKQDDLLNGDSYLDDYDKTNFSLD
ncbi:hypothetical protein P280DRAFT_517339 [Massarina eburnea CBS 473.64]|uniref:Chromo domain-containing protein n=1 Tax=Massarina eburnea CBS 473.64 TaxID=1395130 RepID=A0A6A6S4M0_9PLEO|nr:hypothetical protein P280DRAFT_517339 [Massarina eburnea CBS 473.64]